jgi:membrane protease YdiL (CAAX protease family)
MKWQRTAMVIVWTLLPWPAVWFGMYHLRSLVWTFVLYHGLCLLPAAIWGRQFWLSHLIMPGARQWLVLSATAIVTTLSGVAVYAVSGDTFVSRSHVLSILTERGFNATHLLPLAIYFVVVNAILEELFWRGVVLNELDYLDRKARYAGTAWTAVAFAAWHYLVLRALLQPGYAEAAVLGILAIGIFCSWLYKRTQSIVLAILWHALVFDLAIIAIFYRLVMVQGPVL